MNYRKMRWAVVAFATLFLWLVEWADQWLIGHVALYAAVYLFTFAVFHALERWQQQAREQAGRFQALFEAAGVGMVLVAPDCRIAEANRSMSHLTGIDQQDLPGRKLCSGLLTDPGTGPTGCPGLCGPSRHTPLGGDEAMKPLTLRHREGHTVPVMASVTPLASGTEGGGFAVLLWDVSERTRLEAEAERRRQQAEGLREIGREIAALPDLRHGLDRILEQARALFGMDLIAWGFWDDLDYTVTWESARGSQGEALRGTVWPLKGSVMGRILAAGRPFLTHNLSGAGAGAGELGMLTAMAVPFRVSESATGVLFCAAEGALTLTDEDVMLFSHLGSHLATAVENANLLDDVQRIATLEERQRLAREMHDSVGQTLTYLGVRHHLIARLAETGDTQGIITEVGSLRTVLQEAHTEVRQSIFHLKDGAAPRTPLTERWAGLIAEFGDRSGVRAMFTADPAVPAVLPEAVEMQLTRILQEALANIRNHAGADSVTVALTVPDGALVLTIADNGCGFEAGEVHGPEQLHFGLSIMRERATAIGAELTIRSMRGAGTTVKVRLPLADRRG